MGDPAGPITFERFAIELREAFANYRNVMDHGMDQHWNVVARRALMLAPRVEPEPPVAPAAAS